MRNGNNQFSYQTKLRLNYTQRDSKIPFPFTRRFYKVLSTMSNFHDSDFEHLRKLCRLGFNPEEKAAIFESIQKVLGYVEQLGEVNTEGVASCNFVLRSMLKNQTRDDEIKELLPRDQFLSNAPDQIGGMVRVPSVMKATE